MKRIHFMVAIAATSIVMATAPLHGQTPSLFTEIMSESGDQSPVPEVASRREVVVDFDLLMTGPPAITIELPSIGVTFIANRSLFEPRAGFDPSGQPLPGVPIEEVSLLWRGKKDDDSLTDVVLTVVDGALSGLVIGAEVGQFAIERTLAGDFLLEMIPSKMATEDPPVEPAPFQALFPARPAWPPIGAARPVVLMEPDSRITAPVPAGTAVIDLLFLYTDAAREESGDDPFDPDATAVLRSAMQRSVDELNAAFVNSGVDAEARIVHIARLNGLQGLEDFLPSGTPAIDRQNLQQTAAIWDLRRQVDADMVSVIVRHSGAFFPACGIAFTQRPGCSDNGIPVPGCRPGVGFASHALNLVAVNCLKEGPTLSHEVGHGTSLEHDPCSTPITAATALRPWAFGHIVGEAGPCSPFGTGSPASIADEPLEKGVIGLPLKARTIMALGNDDDVQRILLFSTPLVLVHGLPAGVVGERDNARVLEETTPIAETFGDVLFVGDFETGTFLLWSGWSGVIP